MEEDKTLTVVPSHKGVTVVPSLLAIDILDCLFQRNVHVAIHRLEFTY